MNEIYELREMLCKELESYGKKGELSAGALDIVDKLAHTIKNLDKIIEGYDGGSYGWDGSYNDSSMPYRGSGSYARGRGRNARRDSMGRYSSNGYSRTGDIVGQLRELMNEAPDDMTRQEIQRLVNKMETM